MSKLSKISFFVASFALFLTAGSILHAYAATTPTLSLSDLYNGDIQISVNADPNAPVQLYYGNPYIPYSSEGLGNIGYTGGNGYFSVTVTNEQYSIPAGGTIYVVVDGATSQTVSWPYSYANNPAISIPQVASSPITFSQNNVTLAPSQNTTVTLYGGSNNYYLSEGSAVVSTSISGNTLTLYGNEDGLATLVVCSNYSCGDIYVTVSSPVTAPSISLSQNSVSLISGQNQSIGIYGTGSYYIYSNSNSYVMSASISGNTLYVYADNPGTSAITVCQSSGSCAVLYATVASNVAIVYPQTLPEVVSYPQPVVSYSQPIISYPQPVISYSRPVSYFQPIMRFFSFVPRIWRGMFRV